MYESKFPALPSLDERYVDARVEADMMLSLSIESEINAYLDSDNSPEAQHEQLHMKGMFAEVMEKCDAQLGELGALDLYVLDPLQS